MKCVEPGGDGKMQLFAALVPEEVGEGGAGLTRNARAGNWIRCDSSTVVLDGEDGEREARLDEFCGKDGCGGVVQAGGGGGCPGCGGGGGGAGATETREDGDRSVLEAEEREGEAAAGEEAVRGGAQARSVIAGSASNGARRGSRGLERTRLYSCRCLLLRLGGCGGATAHESVSEPQSGATTSERANTLLPRPHRAHSHADHYKALRTRLAAPLTR